MTLKQIYLIRIVKRFEFSNTSFSRVARSWVVVPLKHMRFRFRSLVNRKRTKRMGACQSKDTTAPSPSTIKECKFRNSVMEHGIFERIFDFELVYFWFCQSVVWDIQFIRLICIIYCFKTKYLLQNQRFFLVLLCLSSNDFAVWTSFLWAI